MDGYPCLWYHASIRVPSHLLGLPRNARCDLSHARGIPRGPMRSLVLTPRIPQDPAGSRGISSQGGREVTINPMRLHGSAHGDFHGIPHDILGMPSEYSACMCHLLHSFEPVNILRSLHQRRVPRHALPPVSYHDPNCLTLLFLPVPRVIVSSHEFSCGYPRACPHEFPRVLTSSRDFP